jgi:hypothetical protein
MKRCERKAKSERWPKTYRLFHLACPKCGGRLRRKHTRPIGTCKRIEHECCACGVRVDAVSEPATELR